MPHKGVKGNISQKKAIAEAAEKERRRASLLAVRSMVPALQRASSSQEAERGELIKAKMKGAITTQRGKEQII